MTKHCLRMLALAQRMIRIIPIIDYEQVVVLPMRHNASMMLPVLEFDNEKLKAANTKHNYLKLTE